MRRREFVALVGGFASAAFSPAAVAQSVRPMLLVGAVSASNPRTTSFWKSFTARMQQFGYTEGENFVFDFTNLHGQLARFPEETAELVRRNVDVIIAPGIELALKSAVAATDTLPIVMVAVDYDPLALGYVSTLARPGRNVTGVFFQQLELTEKRLQLVKEAFPELAAATVLWDRISFDQWDVVQRMAPQIGLRVAGVELDGPPHDYDRLLSQAPGSHRGALIVLMTPAVFPDRARLAEAALRQKMGSAFGLRAYAEAGGLLSYGPNIDVIFQRVADYVGRIANGEKPSDLPIEQPTRFELVINLKTAKALGLEVPPTLLARADEVIE